jgi:hypothetical protein
MLTAKKYRNRHIILKTLEDYRVNNARLDSTDWMELSLDFSELVAKSNLTGQEVIEQLQYLINENEVHEEELRPLDYVYIITKIGTAVYYDKKYLNIGMRQFLNDCYDVLKNLSTAILLIFAVVSFMTNNIEIKKNKVEIESLKNEIKKLKKIPGQNNTTKTHSR